MQLKFSNKLSEASRIPLKGSLKDKRFSKQYKPFQVHH